MLQWISRVYTSPRAAVKVNGNGAFLHCQWYPPGLSLSPLLFALTLEQFLSRVRLNENISGLQMGALQYKLSDYADDMLLSLTNPHVSFLNLMLEFEIHGDLSNLK